MKVPEPWTPEPFEADDGTVPYERFIESLSDFKFVALEAAISQVLSVPPDQAPTRLTEHGGVPIPGLWR